MRYLSKPQLRLLKKIRKIGAYDCTDITNEELNAIKFLRSEGFLDATTKHSVYPTGNGSVATAETGITSVWVSEAGKAYFTELSIDRFRYTIPVIMSIFATIISLIALLGSLSLI